MPPSWLEPVATAVVPAAASLIGQERANQTNRQIAREQMFFQERMSNTAYQRAVRDMRLAGINPMLAYMQGGASSPGGATTRVEDAVGPAVSSAVHALRLRKELRLLDAQVQNTQADSYRKMQEAALLGTRNKIEGFGVQEVPGGEVIPYRALALVQQYRNLQSQGRYTEANVVFKQLESLTLRAGLPAAQLLGTKGAAWTRLLFGGSGVVGGVAKPLIGAFGASRIGKVVKQFTPKRRRY